MKYFDELCRAMEFLGRDERTIFLGQAVACPGTAMSNTLKNISRDKLLELPVTEEMQMGMSTGLALGGHVPASVNPISETLAFGNSGMIRILAVTGMKRSRFLPDVPTMIESGYKDVHVESWLGLFAPAKTPTEVIGHLSQTVREALDSPDLVASLSKIGNEPTFAPPAEFAATIKADLAAWGPVVKASGFVAED